jgi:hypothetical protein
VYPQKPFGHDGARGERRVTAEPNSGQNQTAGGSLGSKPPPTQPNFSTLQSASANPERRYTGLELWLHRITVLMFVFVCAVVGVLLVILPWRPEWTDNRLLLVFPELRSVVTNGFVRGVCSGLGVLDIWIGFWEAVHYQEMNGS